MPGRRICYFLTLLTGFGFYIAYGQWLSALLLAVILGLPWLSLLLSLPAIFTFRLEIAAPERADMGEPGEVFLRGITPWPIPPYRGRVRAEKPVTGERFRLWDGDRLPTGHCGGLHLSVEKARVCDYLGIFSFPVRKAAQKTLRIEPRPLPPDQVPDLQKFQAHVWQPKPGGGYAENHELRLYRPGDSLNQVHWKLTAKTGKLTIREAMEPRRGLVLLTMTLRGTEEELDRKFGRLRWLGTFLTDQEVSYELRVLTGNGVRSFPVENHTQFQAAMDSLLCEAPALSGSIKDQAYAAAWQRHIGGALHES